MGSTLEIQAAQEEAKVVGHDETGWRQGNKKAWLWATVSDQHATYKVDLRRSGEVARSLVGGEEFGGHVQSDRYKAYTCYPMERRAICHAHLKRDYKKIEDRTGPGQEIGKKLCEREAAVFTEWHAFKSNLIDRPTLRERMQPISEAIKALLESAARCGDSTVEGMCKDILKHWPAMWTFTVAGVNYF